MANDISKLLKAARDARRRAVAPYSGFKVGAALRTAGGVIYSGCNIENATLGLTVCAERVALFKALSAGAKRFSDVMVFTASDRPTPPCGACRQVLWEFCGDAAVHMATTRGRRKSLMLSELFPHAFDKRDL